jgi:hypothetical protein
VVVRAHRRERDHRSRSSWPSLLYLMAEGSLRELTGPSRVLGNHVVLDLGQPFTVRASRDASEDRR